MGEERAVDGPMRERRNWRDVYYTSRDGLRLHVRHYPAEGSPRRPLVCLPGLTRNSSDFHNLATVAADPSRHRREVYCIDYRGHGLSAWDGDPSNYSIFVETLDLMDFMSSAGITDAALLGSSHGGLVAMALAALRPAAIGTVILNDIGPVLARAGYIRLVSYVGRAPLPATWEEAMQLTRSLMVSQFPDVTDAQWMELARQSYNDDHGLPMHGYDPRLAEAVSLLNGGIPPLWPQFQALARVPAMVIRGQLSDVLSPETVTRMQQEHPMLTAVTVRGQGHAPLLKDTWTVEAIAKFLLDHEDDRLVGR